MHFSFILLRIKGLYMFRALLAHLHECSLTAIVAQPTDIISTQYTHASPPEDEQVMLETCKGP
jgi:hypothetical protein